MTWLDECLIEQEKLRKRKQFISARADEVFDSLWEAIKRLIGEAKQKLKGFTLSTNGGPEARVVELTKVPLNSQSGYFPKKLAINLAKDKSAVSVVIPDGGGSVQLILDICEDNVVCLKHEGEQISINDAAILALGPFLFPELHGIERKDEIFPTS
jgi:hypothetical protein